mmetsp:Transcript_30704/g.76829  ORF Transcript_30704/g.76829 Transcript_30704/m.76829 type:complete len:218 (+) Transcript_30704:375-1028(+)
MCAAIARSPLACAVRSSTSSDAESRAVDADPATPAIARSRASRAGSRSGWVAGSPGASSSRRCVASARKGLRRVSRASASAWVPARCPECTAVCRWSALDCASSPAWRCATRSRQPDARCTCAIASAHSPSSCCSALSASSASLALSPSACAASCACARQSATRAARREGASPIRIAATSGALGRSAAAHVAICWHSCCAAGDSSGSTQLTIWVPAS